MKVSWKKGLALVLAIAMVLTGTWYAAPTASAAKKASVKLSKTSAKVKKGKKLTLKLKKTNVKKNANWNCDRWAAWPTPLIFVYFRFIRPPRRRHGRF